MSIIFFGTPAFSVPTLRALINAGESISLVVTQPDRKSGRGRKTTPPPVKIIAEEHHFSVYQPNSLRDRRVSEKLKELRPEFIIVVAYGKILTQEILDIPQRGCINVHASLLPKYRGAAPIQWAIIQGEEVTGITTMLMDTGLDTGDILLKQEVMIEATDNSETLSEKLSATGAEVLVKTIHALREHAIHPRPQKGASTYAPLLKKEDGRIDWNKNARELFDFIRGMHPWPSASTTLKGKYIRILEAEPLNGEAHPGTIAGISPDCLILGTGGGLLCVKTLQVEGKKPMGSNSFVNGYRVKVGDRFE